MAAITVYDRVEEGKYARNRVSDVLFGSTVAHFKQQISKCIGRPENTFNVVYCGQCLKDNMSLETYGLHPGSTVHLLPASVQATKTEQEGQSTVDIKDVKTMVKQLQAALKNPAYKSTVESILTCPDKLQDIVNAVPELDNNPATLSLFQDQDLLKVLAHPGNIRRLLEAHPCLPKVVQLVCDRVTEAGNSGQFTSQSSVSYSLDHMSEDDDDDAAGPSGNQAITANQLAAALAAAAGASPITPATAQSGSRPLANNMITQDFFEQAIRQAQDNAMTGQIAQMREMGITDENVARQALQATNGDLQAALDLLLGEGMS